MEHKIVIAGPIGSFQYNGKDITGVSLLDVVGQVNSAPEGTDTIRVQIDSVGGRVDVGNNIYNYLNSLKSKYKVITEQIGMVASIATKIFGVGDIREAKQGQFFMIHNPWTSVEGDSQDLSQAAIGLKLAEDDLISFYTSLTGVSKEGLAPLLSDQTEFGADDALKLKFATKINLDYKIAAYMNENKIDTLIGALNTFLKKFTGKALNLVVELEDGTKAFVATEDATKLEGMSIVKVDAQDQPTQESLPDGAYKLKDGRTVNVSSGKVSTVDVAPTTPPPAAATPPPAAPASAPAPVAVDPLAARIEEIVKSLEKFDLSSIEKSIDEKINALRSEIKTKHKPVGYTPESSVDDSKAWDLAFKANETGSMKKNDPEKFQRLFYAKYGKMPNM